MDLSHEHDTNLLFLSSIILLTQLVWYVNVCITLYSFPFILYNLIVLSSEPETKIPELNCIIQNTE